jgi:hypothetical protein
MDNTRDKTESPVVMWTNYKRTDGFEVSVTLRGDDLKEVATLLDNAIKGIVSSGGTPVSRQRGGFTPKPKEYVEGRTCPVDGAKLVKSTTKTGKNLIKCENNKWDAVNKRAVGCQYIDWGNNNIKPRVEEGEPYPDEYGLA